MSKMVTPTHPWIVSVEWLSEQLNNPDLVVVDCRFRLDRPDWGESQYRLGHIPGAYYLSLDRDLSSPVTRHGGRHPLPALEQLAPKLSQCGVINPHSRVIVYDDSRFAFAARLWWLLRYWGHEQVAVLDGGWQAWSDAHYPISQAIPADRPGHFQANLQSDWIVDREHLLVPKQERVVIDARDRDRYLGIHEPIDPIAGHIPGAVNSPWQAVTDDRGFLLPLPHQHELWQAYQSSSELVVYCGSGVTACVNLLSLALIGRTDAKLYPGGWSDWCSYEKAG